MSIETYKIVNATKLDEDLASIANALKAKNGDSKDYAFPSDFVDAIDYLYYDNDPNTVNDLTVNGDTITAGAGYYPSAVSKNVGVGSVTLPIIEETENPTITNSNGKIVASYTKTVAVEPEVVEGYITGVNNGSIKVSGTAKLQLATVEGGDVEPSEGGDYRIGKNQYLLSDLVIKAVPTNYVGSAVARPEELTQDGLVVTAPAGYYSENATLEVEVPDNYLDMTGITTFESAENVIAAGLDNTQLIGVITIPAGYYPEGITITLPEPESEENPPSEE